VINDEEYDKIYLVTEFIAGGPSMSWHSTTATFYFNGVGKEKETEKKERGGSGSGSGSGHSCYSEGMARIALRQVISAVSFLHRSGIAHHDIKPENILTRTRTRTTGREDGGGGSNGGGKEEEEEEEEEMCFVLCDFGAAMKYTSNDVHISNTTGTHAFFAPEMCMGVDQADEEKSGGSTGFSPFVSDVWAIGVTLYAYVYGQLPFWDDRGGQCLFDAIVQDELKLPPYQLPTGCRRRGRRRKKEEEEEKEQQETSGATKMKLGNGIRHLLKQMLHKDQNERLTLDMIDGWLNGEMLLPVDDATETETFIDVDEDIVSF
jgi:serine/threonine protein kinase